MSEIDTATASLIQLDSILRRVQKWLISVLIALFLFEMFGNWVLLDNPNGINFPGAYWLMILSSNLGGPLYFLCLLTFVVSIIAWVPHLVWRGPDAKLVLHFTANLTVIMVIAIPCSFVAGFPSNFIDFTHEASVTANGKTYFLAEKYSSGQYLNLYECDSIGLFCQHIYTSDDIFTVPCFDYTYTLSIDPATGGPVLTLEQTPPCRSEVLYPPD